MIASKTERLKLYYICYADKFPIFYVPVGTHGVRRVFGYKPMLRQGLLAFPAFYPFGLDVLRDFEIISNGSLELTEEAEAQAEFLKQTQKNVEEQFLDPDFKFFFKPFEHQKLSLIQAFHFPRYGILLDCGLGKTKVLIDLIRYLRFKGLPFKSLILTPPVVLSNWRNEFSLHSEDDFNIVLAHGTKAQLKKRLDNTADVVITTHTMARSKNLEPYLKEQKFDLIAVDESHKLKTPNSETTKSLVKLAQPIFRRYILSGTPTAGNPIHLYGQLKFLGEFNVEPSLYSFQQKFQIFLDPKSRDRIRRNIVIGSKNMEILHNRINRISIKKTIEECVDLPEIRTIDLSYELTFRQKSMYNQLVQAHAKDIPSEFQQSIGKNAFQATRLTKLAQILSGFYLQKNEEGETEIVEIDQTNKKLEHLVELVDDILAEPTNKVVIWARFRKEIFDIAEALKEYGCIPVVGGDSAQATEFDKSPDKRVLVGQISLGEGFNAVSANYVVYYSIDFDSTHYKQSRDRARRIGQKRKVTIYRFRRKDSVDDFMYKLLKFKDKTSNILTERSYCVVCPHQDECLEKGTEMFGMECRISGKNRKQTISPVYLGDSF